MNKNKAFQRWSNKRIAYKLMDEKKTQKYLLKIKG